MFNIRSVSSDRDLIFSDRNGEYFSVELKGSNLSAFTKVWDGHVRSLYLYFQELANFKTPWQGSPSWGSLENEFEISASCSALGHVLFLVKFSGQLGGTEEWEAQAGLDTEFGQLEQIAKKAKLFFGE